MSKLTRSHAHQYGGAILFLFVAIALFGALSWAMLGNSRGSLSMIESERGKAEGTRQGDCSNTLTLAVQRLKLRGCTSYSFATEGGGDCGVFSPTGGGAKACPALAGWCVDNRALLQEGQACGGIIYLGVWANHRLYTTAADSGRTAYNHGGVPLPTDNAFMAKVDYGMLNTNDLMAASVGGPYNAARLCRSLGPDWYLPSLVELRFLFRARKTGGMLGTVQEGQKYWGSNFSNAFEACSGLANDTFANFGSCMGTAKETVLNVRCVRR
ncbi:hypothetical protein M527_12640 [Sphingobium indicum IP26]|uniref:DUF1566 domain-containing protein n=1 Tax=Sphingobium quisquiliarum P25 TaxID=1329909 RepID=T0GVE1_9SPHN|nr:hypothetical protein [Sphingobium quisquiliarum]EPR18419.1 hypothetical protein M527_12640 [Sphingobium indicum IP26]EQB04657.1 hypothetical protein L288_13425 [Sphingobium quisquiliarum P25]